MVAFWCLSITLVTGKWHDFLLGEIMYLKLLLLATNASEHNSLSSSRSFGCMAHFEGVDPGGMASKEIRR
jgi:hypothetical protein